MSERLVASARQNLCSLLIELRRPSYDERGGGGRATSARKSPVRALLLVACVCSRLEQAALIVARSINDCWSRTCSRVTCTQQVRRRAPDALEWRGCLSRTRAYALSPAFAGAGAAYSTSEQASAATSASRGARALVHILVNLTNTHAQSDRASFDKCGRRAQRRVVVLLQAAATVCCCCVVVSHT